MAEQTGASSVVQPLSAVGRKVQPKKTLSVTLDYDLAMGICSGRVYPQIVTPYLRQQIVEALVKDARDENRHSPSS